jgi:alginate O-acetyltransferase complex protein AlgI
MLFTELRFLPFFLLVFAVHWGLRRERERKGWLLLCSYFFYGVWDWRFLSLILISTLVDYIAALRVGNEKRSRGWLLVSLGVNLGLLAIFKYFGFFLESAYDLLHLVGVEGRPPALEIVLPVGISFYTFQTLSYTIDVYRGTLAPRKNLLDVALFVAFFPQLVAGPIMRAAKFLPQLDRRRRFLEVDVRAALVLFLVGFFKKSCVSDNLSPLVERYFENPESYDNLSAWIGTVAYAIQIYCDFSGYSDMAIACAALLGFRLCLNFNFPYFAHNIAEFWRRWHISLSTWLRDYLYIPLGGNRGSKWAVRRNLLLTMLIGGLWHGASWTFVVWGGLHGLALIVHRIWKAKRGPKGALPKVVSIPATFALTCLAWIFFRASTLEEALQILARFTFLDRSGTQTLELHVLLPFALLALLHTAAYRRWGREWWRRGPEWAFTAGYAAAVALVVPFISVDYDPFIYFQF